MSTFAVKGGIGDFLQCLPFMLAHPNYRYLVASHYGPVPEFFGALGLSVEELSLGKLAGVENCPREWFFTKNPFPKQAPLFTNGRPVTGIHLGGSIYSLSMEKRFGFPPKALPITVFNSIVLTNKYYNIILFGEAKELDLLKPDWRESKNEHIKYVADEDVTVSLSRVAECSALIGSDSAFKTMSAMLHIPTIIWVGDYRDDFRDSMFIDPYVKEGVVSVIRYKDLSLLCEVLSGVKQCQELLANSKVKYVKFA